MSLSCIIVEDLQVAANYLKNCCEKKRTGRSAWTFQ